ncbi:hypothetical protein [Flavivirga jejuensis]|uniref:Uncharacterized protein n=1 Tax=Flavivirga jejuensis TaxID=870487 RepID=A0ABT8WNX5_9FLAO|nr:hypothetical protein [Flavivirga jejuensis]MDO5974849.1 hypothetical protein [Flavivirga jejuensis]
MNHTPGKVIKNTFGEYIQTSSIFHWINGENTVSHCLFRIYLWNDQSRVVIVLTEIKSNNGIGIVTSFKEVMEAVFSSFNTEIHIPFNKVEWFIHYGYFSGYDVIPTREILIPDPNNIDVEDALSIPETITIYPKDYDKYLYGIDLGKLRPLLAELDWELIDRWGDAEWE